MAERRRRPPRTVWQLVGLGLLVAVLQTGYTTWAIHNSNVQARAAARVAQHRICTTLWRLARDAAPDSGPAAAYLQTQHAILSELAPDIHCPARPATHVPIKDR